MKCSLSLILILTILSHASAQFRYPATPKVSQSDNYHGVKIEDPYRWLENDTSEATLNWVAEQSKFTEAYLEAIPYRHQLRKRISDFYNYPRYSSPFRNGQFYYYYKNEGLQNFPVLYRQVALDGEPQVVIDPNTFSLDGSIQLTQFVPSKDGHYAAWAISTAGSDWQTILVKDLITLADLGDTIRWVKGSDIAWHGNGFYYSRYPAPARGQEFSSKNENQQLWYHTAGTPQSADKLIYQDSLRPLRFYSACSSEDERYVFVSIEDRGVKGRVGNALWYRDHNSADTSFKPIVADPGEYIYGIVDPLPDNKFLIQTNDDAPQWRLIVVDPASPERTKWKTLVAERDETLELATLGGGQLFLKYLKDASSRIYVYSTRGKFLKELELPGPGEADIFQGRHDDTLVFYTYRSLNYPTHIFQYHVASGETSLFRKPDMIFNPTDYVTYRRFVTSRDGTRIPIFLVHRKDLKRNGSNPTLLYGYGGFNYSPGLNFSTPVMPWLEQGGVYAIACLRGGGEYGEEWHKAGMLHRKQRTFDDFIAAAEYLVDKKYTSPSHLAIRGASNGGLLVGAVMNQRPGLFRVAVPEVGVMDMLRFQKFTIGWNWIAEYGTSDNENDFMNLVAYSPLHNIRQGAVYPATLVVTADHDDRVVPAHSFKYLATLQEKASMKHPALLKVQTTSGHGLSSIVKNIELAADIFSFIWFNLGAEWKGEKNNTDDK